MDNLYKTDKPIFDELIEETKKQSVRDFKSLSVSHIKKAWFSIIESTGGSAKSDMCSSNKEERALAHIERAFDELNS